MAKKATALKPVPVPEPEPSAPQPQERIVRTELTIENGVMAWDTGLSVRAYGATLLGGDWQPAASVLTLSSSGTAVTIAAWKAKEAGDSTLVPATGPVAVLAWAIGT